VRDYITLRQRKQAGTCTSTRGASTSVRPRLLRARYLETGFSSVVRCYKDELAQ